MGFVLRAHERHDGNLKRNMEFALNSLRKREEMDRAREDENIKALMDREQYHHQKKAKTSNKLKADFDKKTKKELDIMENKSKHYAEVVSQIISDIKYKDKAKSVTKSKEEICEKSRMQTVLNLIKISNIIARTK